MKNRNEAIDLLCGVSMKLDRLQVELCEETPYETPTAEQTRKRILSTFDAIERICEILTNNKED